MRPAKPSNPADLPPGLKPHRLIPLMESAIERCRLDLSGRVVLTEAASGAYVVTPILAALAGARYVYAMTGLTRYGSPEEVTIQTYELADRVEIKDKIEIINRKSREIVSRADIITNSGHLRPINAEMVGWMKPSAVVPLMYEAWELRPGDVDLEACRQKGILVAGTNERHPAVDVFSFLGMMAVKLLLEAGISVYSGRVLLLCDNPFAPFIETGLSKAGATVDVFESIARAVKKINYDVILVALQPGAGPVLGPEDAHTIAQRWPDTVVAQFWGDIDRSAFLNRGLVMWPPEAPEPGHMGILPSDVGPEPVVCLQVGGLKVGEILSKYPSKVKEEELEFIQFL